MNYPQKKYRLGTVSKIIKPVSRRQPHPYGLRHIDVWFACHHIWQISIKIDIKTSTCEKLVPNSRTCEKLVPNYHTYEELVLNCHRCQWRNCEELDSNAKCSIFGGILYMWGIRMYVTWNLTPCVFFTSVRYWYEICDVLVPIFYVLRGIDTNSSQCEIYEVRNLRFNNATL